MSDTQGTTTPKDCAGITRARKDLAEKLASLRSEGAPEFLMQALEQKANEAIAAHLAKHSDGPHDVEVSVEVDPDESEDTDAWLDEIKAVLAKHGRVMELILTSTPYSRMISFNSDICKGPAAELIRLGIAAYINEKVRE